MCQLKDKLIFRLFIITEILGRVFDLHQVNSLERGFIKYIFLCLLKITIYNTLNILINVTFALSLIMKHLYPPFQNIVLVIQ